LTFHFDANYSYPLPSEIGQLLKLKKLFILNYPFTEFPEWVFGLTNLEDLTIRGNEIRVIPPGLGQLSKLRRLRIENTNLETFPSDIQDLKNLKSLSLVDNFELKELDPEHLPPNLIHLVMTPSAIPEGNQNKIKQLNPHLKSRYWW